MLIKARNTAKGLQRVTPNQVFQRSPIAFEHTKAEKTQTHLPNEICHTIYFFASSKISYFKSI